MSPDAPATRLAGCASEVSAMNKIEHHPAQPPSDSTFQESSLRTTHIRDMGLQIAGTRLESIIREFEAELDALGLTRLRPRLYLSTGVVE